ncbi:MAG: hypothetical protein R3C19_03285 [Planctomycetaceae bacterium]
MGIENYRQRENTIASSRTLERLMKEKQDNCLDEQVRELTLRSMRKLINQFTEEIVQLDSRRWRLG